MVVLLGPRSGSFGRVEHHWIGGILLLFTGLPIRLTGMWYEHE